MSTPKIHYSGGLRFVKANDYTVDLLRGWAACVTPGPNRTLSSTFMKSLTTCKRCQNLLRRAGYRGEWVT